LIKISINTNIMDSNTLGDIFRVQSFGESHGPCIGCVIDGVPANIVIDIEAIQDAVNLRKTNTNNFASARNETDTIEIVSGVFENKTLGSPICILIKNNDAHSADYDDIKTAYRPNHADYTNAVKYGFRDHRGGGRTSIRITAPMVAAGALALQIIAKYSSLQITSFVSNIGIHSIDDKHKYFNTSQGDIFKNNLRCPDDNTCILIEKSIENALKNKDTLGGCITTVINNIDAGIGSPIFKKLQAQLAQAMLSINTVKGFEYGDGFEAATQNGSQHNDSFITENNIIKTATNHSGGIQGGISNGMPIFFTTAFKPISSIGKMQQTINEKGDNIAIEINGRHDVCAVPRAIPIVNAYTAIVLLNEILKNEIIK
jgi:chorismate synthase